MLKERLRVLLGLVFTGAAIHFIPNRPIAIAILLVGWFVIFFPLTLAESVIFVLAAAFFTAQNYVCLKAGLFAFRDRDFLLMPYFEPALWGFYFLSMKRWISGRAEDYPALEFKTLLALVVTSVVFSVFSTGSRPLLIATTGSTLLLFALFHTRRDLEYAAFALVLGFLVELFGVKTGLWSYPVSDFLGIPLWFATMWLSVGLLGRRFALPAAAWLARRVQRV